MSLPFLKKDDAHEFKPVLTEIEEDPGSPLGAFTFWLVIIVFAFFLLWTIFGQVDVVVSARGKVIPVGEVKLVQPLSGGIVSQILVKEGDKVRKGQPLVIIDPSTTQPQLASSEKTLSHIQMEQARLKASASGTHFSAGSSIEANTQTRLYHNSLEALKRQLNGKEKELENLNAQLREKNIEQAHTQEMLTIAIEKETRLQQVRDIIAKDDYEKTKTEVLTNQNKLKTLEQETAQLNFQKEKTIEEMAYLRHNFKSTTLQDLSEKEKQATQLEAQIQEVSFKNARQTLVSPVDGYVHELFVHTVGGVVTSAQKLVSIVPVGTPLQIQSIVENRDIGFIKNDMPVEIKVDTFDFQKYGTLKGSVAHVDHDSIDDPKQGPVYTIHVTPLEQRLLIDGKWQALTSGLSVTSEIKTGKRHIIEFFIYPLIKHLDEGLSVR